VDVVDLAFAFLQGFLNDLLFFEIVDLFFDFPSFLSDKRLTEHEKEGGGDRFGLPLSASEFAPVQKLGHNVAERVF